MIENDLHPLDEELELFVKREAANETQGTIAGQNLAKHLPRRLVDGAQGAQISAHELKDAGPVLAKIKDPVLRQTVQSYFAIATKYQALNMLIAEHSRLRAEQPEILGELVSVITKADRLLKGQARRALEV